MIQKQEYIVQIFDSLFPEGVCPDTEEFRKARQKSLAIAMALNSQFTPEQLALWDSYTSACTDMAEAQQLECFWRGIALGVQIVLGAFQ